jgi:hypothetical protein
LLVEGFLSLRNDQWSRLPLCVVFLPQKHMKGLELHIFTAGLSFK